MTKRRAKRRLRVATLARVEGQGGLDIEMRGDRVTAVKLQIFEPPRLFEAVLRGRSIHEVPDMVARICGICPIAYQMSSVHAIEKVLGIAVDPSVRELRRLFLCAEWIASHTLHVYMLHAPDFLGYPDAIRMAHDHPDRVRAGLELKKIGNQLMTLLGGREIHPISVCVGGFYRTPSRHELLGLLAGLRRARDLAVDTARWASRLPFPDFVQDYEFVALSHPGEYPLNEGRLVSSKGLDIAVEEYGDHFVERQVPHSTALHSSLRERGSYLVGPLARFNLNFERLPASVRDLGRECGVPVPCCNPFQSIAIRALETLFACEEAIRIVEAYQPPAAPRVEVSPRAGVGHACSEAPRGTLYQRYQLDGEGRVVSVRIVPPTSQNQGRIEEDLISLGPRLAAAPDEEVKRLCEQSVRNYDPCISCSTHFLKVNIERRGGPDVGEGSPGAAAASERKPRVAVIGCGSQGRGDDAAGLMVARRLRGQVGAEVSIREVAGDGLEVLEEWAGCSKVILVDAMVSGAPVGSVRRLDGRRLLGLEWPQLSSTHSLGLREALRVSETLGLSPQGLVVIGIEGGQFGPGDPISAGVVEGIQGAVSAVLDELASLDGQCLDE